ncbi:uncharacterized protein STEHIDRAFT_171813 [Stereum hirsutum FP-91666 SS1]|uniref:uncharacterized protein n=1 Tax=Stereum hirsutum (strain FP-91666) TaxID=721885 RepID=UPI000444A260|nr:uncharacterized protein STEHIDRAFT_171813 [Stereum hirsutum FP-91666 SS1]EIM81444.1 hypothetical protein STEHIDRAFT_171813 [Stereum hirsutum FP-91666 SS1]
MSGASFLRLHRAAAANWRGRKDHERADDLESALHVLVYVAFRYHNSSLSDEALIDQMQDVFDNFVTVDDVHSGGAGKHRFFLGDRLSGVVAASFPEPLACLVGHLRNIFVNIYTRRPEPIRDSARPRERMLGQRSWDRYHEDQKLAETYLSTSDTVIETFKECLAMGGWGDEEAPKDRLERMPKTAGALELAYNRKRACSFATPTSNKKFKKDMGTGD